MIKTTRYPNIGGFGGGQQTTEYYVKSYGLWRRLDVWGNGAVAINPQTVVFFAKGQPQVIRQGERVQRPACGEGMFFATIARESRAIDCVQALTATTIRYRRIEASGRVVNDKTIPVESPGREFVGAQVRFYDDGERPFFITGREWPYKTLDCAIVDEDGHSIAAPDGTSASDCANPLFWSKVLRRRLH